MAKASHKYEMLKAKYLLSKSIAHLHSQLRTQKKSLTIKTER